MALYPYTIKDFRVVNVQNSEEIGLATITAPKVTFERSEYTGAGVTGRISLPIPGNVQMSDVTFDFHTTTQDSLNLFNGASAQIRCISSLGAWDTSAGDLAETSEEIFMTVISAEYDLGKREYSSKGAIMVVATPIYLALYYNNVKTWEIDPFAGICIVNSVDLNAQTTLNLAG